MRFVPLEGTRVAMLELAIPLVQLPALDEGALEGSSDVLRGGQTTFGNKLAGAEDLSDRQSGLNRRPGLFAASDVFHSVET